MPRKKKQKIKVNDTEALEGLLQEVYNEACGNINSAQKEITRLSEATEPEDVDDHTKIAKSKEGLLKIKDSSLKIKLEVAKMQNDSIKQNGNVEGTVKTYSGGATTDDFAEVRRIMLEKKANENGDK
jgi:ADP-dependent phosphofructokinase/glucokinase